MKSIEELIRSRQRGGQKSGRKRFKLARQRAVAKMRKFALADPAFFVLELIQSGIAHGATMIHVGASSEFEPGGGKFSLLYGGRHYRREELGQLFDFLFTEKGSLENAHLRDLAIGINSLLLYNPSSIEVLTGDGTLRGSTHMRVEGGGTAVELGAPDEPVRGVHVLARGVRHPSLKGVGLPFGASSGAAKQPTIASVVRERCMLTPIPIVLNGESISGYSSHRSLPLFGYKDRTPIDEGDLYGTIGLTKTEALRGIKLMVRGVWIETIPHPDDVHGPGGRWKGKGRRYVGGALSFDRLRKTADHAGVVRDERYQELMIRLDPYIRLTRSQKKASDVATYQNLEGRKLTLPETRSLVLEAERVICLLRHKVGSPVSAKTRDRLTALWRNTGYPVLLTSAHTPDHLVSLSGGDSDVIDVWEPSPKPKDDRLLRHYERPLSDPPAEPWLLEPLAVASVRFDELIEAVATRHDVHTRKSVASALGRKLGHVEAKLYTPVQIESARFALAVWVRVGGRVITKLRAPCAYPGHVLVVDLPGVSPEHLRVRSGPEVERDLDRHSVPDAIAAYMVEVAQPAIEAAAAAGTRTLVAGTVRPKTTPAYKALALIARVGTLRWDVDESGAFFWFSLPKEWESLLDADLLETGAGEFVSLRELGRSMSKDRGRIRWGRDSGDASDSSSLALDDVELECLRNLAGESALLRVLTHWDPHPSDAREPFAAGVVSPAARCMNVQFVQNRALERFASGRGADEVFVEDANGVGLSLAFLRRFTEGGGRLVLHRRGAPRLVLPAETGSVEGNTLELSSTPFELSLLGEAGLCTAQTAETFDDVYDATLMCVSEIDEPGLVGSIGVPSDRDAPRIVVVDCPDGRHAIRDDPTRFGVCGFLRSESLEVAEERVRDQARRVMTRALERVVEPDSDDPDTRERLLDALTAFAARHTFLSTGINDTVVAAVSDPLAHRVLQLPLFPRAQGLPETALAILEDVRVGESAPPRPPYASPSLNRFIRSSLCADALPPEPELEALLAPQNDVGLRVSELLDRFRPDSEGPVQVVLERRAHFDGVTLKPRTYRMEGGVAHGAHALSVNTGVPLISGLATDAADGDEQALTWLALLAYAKLNELLDGVTNEHERIFQARVTDALLNS